MSGLFPSIFTLSKFLPPTGPEMEERNDEWGEGCHIDGGHCIGCGDCGADDLSESPGPV